MLINLFIIVVLLINRRAAALSYNLPLLCPNASWSNTSTIFPTAASPSYKAHSLFVSSNNTVYISEKNTGGILMWLEHQTNPQTTVFGGLTGALTIFLGDTGEIYVDQGSSNRVSKATMNANSNTIVMSTSNSCTGLFIDVNNTFYCSIAKNHQVLARSLDNISSITRIVAGNGSNGTSVGMFSYPYGIFVDRTFRLYVADCGNNRIQRFDWGSLNGTILTEIGGGSSNITLDHPTSVVLDLDDNLFILDHNGNRIVQFRADRFWCIVGCPISSLSGPPPLWYAETLSFDSYGNIYTTGLNDGTIRIFRLMKTSCDHSTTTPLQQSSSSIMLISSKDTTNIPNTTMSTDKSSALIISTSSGEPSSTALDSSTVEPLLTSFVAPMCPNTTRLGIHCNISALPCDLLNPCENKGTCLNVNTGYTCQCAPGFNGSECQYDHHPCPPDRCWNNGLCIPLTNTTFKCSCAMNWTGVYCERKINYCENVHCENNGVCRPLLGDYQCECLGESFSGRHCEMKSTALVVRQVVCKSFASIAIIAMASIIIFVVTMDAMKYIFGIDPTRHELERIRRRKRPKKVKPPLVQRFVYRDAPSTFVP